MYKLAVEVEVIALTENPLGGTAITIGVDIEIPKIMVFVGVPAVGNTAAGAVNELRALFSAIVNAIGLVEVFRKPQ
jgi:hypothetical protein